MSDYRKKTLEQLEREKWEEPSFTSYLVTTCHRLRKIPVGQLDIEDLRILLGQSIGVSYLLPLALDILSASPLAEGDYYPGDLLSSVLRLDNKVWMQHPDWEKRLETIVLSIADMPEPIRHEWETYLSLRA